MIWDSYPGVFLGNDVCKTVSEKSWGWVLTVQISVYMDAGTPAGCIGGGRGSVTLV